jgi:hypothetical protein
MSEMGMERLQPMLEGLAADVTATEVERIRDLVLNHLRGLGFDISELGSLRLTDPSKQGVRAVYAAEAAASAEALCAHFGNNEDKFLAQLASGRPDPRNVRPVLVAFERGSEEAELWRWIVAHWSVPVSQGYGRRIRFLVRDANNHGSVIGVIGLADPVFALAARDKWLGWDGEERKIRLSGVMEAFALGAVPPYDSMLGGKLIAMLCASLEVKEQFKKRYMGVPARISGRRHDGILRAVTTQSAFGRSSLYNRLRRPDGRPMWIPIGYTGGSGDGHIFGEAYMALRSLDARLRQDGEVGSRGLWKERGARNKKDVLFSTLPLLGLDPRKLRQHGIQRQAFIAPLDASCVPSGGEAGAGPTPLSVEDTASWWSLRWGERASSLRPASQAGNWRLLGGADGRQQPELGE